MIIYTIEEVRAFARIYQGHSEPSGLTTEEMEKYGGNFDYVELMESVIKDKKLPGASLTEFLGAYEMVGANPEGWQILRHLLFEAPLKEMPKHINDSGKEAWKARVAQWRLQLNK